MSFVSGRLFWTKKGQVLHICNKPENIYSVSTVKYIITSDYRNFCRTVLQIFV